MVKGIQARDGNHRIVPSVFHPGATQKIATGAATAALTKGDLVRVVCDADSHIVFGTGSPSAAVTDIFMPGSHVEYFEITKASEKIAVLGGNMYVTVMGVDG